MGRSHYPHVLLAVLVTAACLVPAPTLFAEPFLNPKLDLLGVDPALRALSPGLQLGLADGETAQSRFASRAINSASFQVDIQVTELNEHLIQQLGEIGADITFSSHKYQFLSVRLASHSQLAALARLPEVLRVNEREPTVSRAGSVQSRAVEALRAPALNTAGHTGSSKVLGVLSDSFARTGQVRDANTTPASGSSGVLQGSRPQDSGNLPAIVNLIREGELSGADEGAAMAELAYDIAPGLGIAFHTAGTSQAAFASAIDTLCDTRTADVIVDDIGFLLEPYYQDGLIAQSAADCVARGVPFVSALGNEGDKAYRKIYADIDPENDEQPASPPFGPTGVDLHNWGGGDGFAELVVPAGGEITVVLQWNQPHASVNSSNGAQIDLDLYATQQELFTALNPIAPGHVDRSIGAQGVTGQPLGDAAEFLVLRAEPGSDTPFYIAIDHYAGSQSSIPQNAATPLEFRIVIIGDLLSSEYPFNGPSAWGHPLAEGVISVAAVPWWEAPVFDPGRFGSQDIDPQPYSSRAGDIAIQFDRQGNFAPVSRFAPTLAGVDGNNNSFFGADFSANENPGFGEPDGAPNFFGTSAAAPNVAAIIILLQEAFPSLSPRAIADGLIASTVDVKGLRAQVGTDDVSGAGLVDGEAALAHFSAIAGNAAPAAQSGVGGGGGCFIATAAYGSYWSREVRILREFRDRRLQPYEVGRWLIRSYYAISPAIAEVIRNSDGLQTLVRTFLTPIVWFIQRPVSGAFLLLGVLFALLALPKGLRQPRVLRLSRDRA